MTNFAPWWSSGILTGVIMLFNLGIMLLLLGGYIFLLIKVASIDRTLKEILEKFNCPK